MAVEAKNVVSDVQKVLSIGVGNEACVEVEDDIDVQVDEELLDEVHRSRKSWQGSESCC